MENKDKEIKATEETKETEQPTGVGELVLRKPIMLDGELVEKIAYDLEELTGEDVSRAVKELGKKGMMVTMSEFDQNYHAMIFSIAAGIMYEDVLRLKAKDFAKVSSIVRNFFLEE